MKKTLNLILITILVALGSIVFYYWYENTYYVSTDDARVSADLVSVTPQISGKLLELNVAEGDTVKKNEILVCMGSACFARGNAQNLEFIENYIKENNLDATVDLAGLRCEGKCAEGPNIMINGVCHNKIDEKKIAEILIGER